MLKGLVCSGEVQTVFDKRFGDTRVSKHAQISLDQSLLGTQQLRNSSSPAGRLIGCARLGDGAA